MKTNPNQIRVGDLSLISSKITPVVVGFGEYDLRGLPCLVENIQFGLAWVRIYPYGKIIPGLTYHQFVIDADFFDCLTTNNNNNMKTIDCGFWL